MKFIVDELFRYCPQCGTDFFVGYSIDPYFKKTHINQDFNAGCSFMCECGAQYQKVPTRAIIETAAKHGDAGQYWK